MEKELSTLEDFKIEYNKLKDEYGLPEFNELNTFFDIEEIDIETDFLLRKIRRTISDKITGYLRFIEIILNPSNAPIFFFNLIKKLDSNDKKKLMDIYEKLGKIEIEIIKLDLTYDKKMEAEFIKKLYEIFKKELSTELRIIIEKMDDGDNNKKNKGKVSYFG